MKIKNKSNSLKKENSTNRARHYKARREEKGDKRVAIWLDSASLHSLQELRNILSTDKVATAEQIIKRCIAFSWARFEEEEFKEGGR